MIKVNETKSKITPATKTVKLENISLADMHLIDTDTDTGEDITQQVIDELPEGTETVNFNIKVELPEEE